jgi:anti-anti-sigma regulatory factor
MEPQEQPPARGRVTAVTADSEHVLVLSGVVDVDLADVLHDAAVAAADSAHDVFVDAGQAEYLDAAAVQTLVALHCTLLDRGRALGIRAASEAARACCEQAAVWALLTGTTR